MNRYKKSGWWGESQRHSLARRGIKTSKKISYAKPVDSVYPEWEGRTDYTKNLNFEDRLKGILSNFDVLDIEKKWNDRQFVVKVENKNKDVFKFDIYVITFNQTGELGSIIKVRDNTKGYNYSAHSGQPFSNTRYLKESEFKKFNVDYSKQSDMIHGGLSDNSNDSDFDNKQIKKGIKVELEHTDNPKIAKEISQDHLKEFPNYYTHLDKMEKDMKKEQKKKKKIDYNEDDSNKSITDKEIDIKDIDISDAEFHLGEILGLFSLRRKLRRDAKKREKDMKKEQKKKNIDYNEDISYEPVTVSVDNESEEKPIIVDIDDKKKRLEREEKIRRAGIKTRKAIVTGGRAVVGGVRKVGRGLFSTIAEGLSWNPEEKEKERPVIGRYPYPYKVDRVDDTDFSKRDDDIRSKIKKVRQSSYELPYELMPKVWIDKEVERRKSLEKLK